MAAATASVASKPAPPRTVSQAQPAITALPATANATTSGPRPITGGRFVTGVSSRLHGDRAPAGGVRHPAPGRGQPPPAGGRAGRVAGRLGAGAAGRGGRLSGLLVRPRGPAPGGQGLPLGRAAQAVVAPGLVRRTELAAHDRPRGAGRRPHRAGQPVPAGGPAAPPVRIVSLLPSATEALFALGLGGQVVAVTHECDFPPEAAQRPIVTRSSLALAGRDSAAIETAVALAAAEGRSLYEVDTDAIRALDPDLVVTQDVCRVCAVPASQVEEELAGVRIIRQHPHSLEDVLADIEELAEAAGADPAPLLEALRERLARAAAEARRRPRVRGVFLEWLDPPYRAGHWTPDLLDLAGIDDPLARPGVPSVAGSWDEVAAARPELLVLAPCGFDRARAQQEADRV